MANFVSVEILKELQAAANSVGAFILNNSPENIEKYRFLAGRLNGLNSAMEIVKEIDSRYEKDED